MTPLKKIAVISAMFFVAMPLIVACLFFAYRQMAHHAAKERLEQQQLTCIRLPAAQLHWYKQDKEIIYNGHLFDVKSIVVDEDGMTTITGLYDFQEQQLDTKIEELFGKKRGQIPIETTLAKWLSVVYLLQENSSPVPVLTPTANFYGASSPITTLTFTTSVPTPPPQCSVFFSPSFL